jgi:hypothetical protein
LDETDERKHSKMDIPQFIEPGKIGGWLLEGESIEDGIEAAKRLRKIRNRKPVWTPSTPRSYFENMREAEWIGMLKRRNEFPNERIGDGCSTTPVWPSVPIIWDRLIVTDCANCGSNLIEHWSSSIGGEVQVQQKLNSEGKLRCCSEMKMAPAEVIPITIFER